MPTLRRPAPVNRGVVPMMKILALPRVSSPYQLLFYQEITRAGHRVRYVGELTRSHTLNLILLPVELTVCRVLGWRVLHIQWVFEFRFPGTDRFPALRALAQAWFAFVLTVSRVVGVRVVWTAHNVLPHEPVFRDDVAARRRLVRSSELVLAHSRATLDALAEIGITPRRSAIVPHGPLLPATRASDLRPPGEGSSVRRLLFFGQVREYKGVEDLLDAMTRLPADARLRLVVAGRCTDHALRRRLQQLAQRSPGRTELRLEEVPETEVTRLMSDSDVVVLPFRDVGTSGSVVLAMGHGRVVVLPDLPAFAELPRDAVVLYDRSVEDLARAIIDVSRWTPQRLQEVGTAAAAYVATLSWADAAREMLAAIGS